MMVDLEKADEQQYRLRMASNWNTSLGDPSNDFVEARITGGDESPKSLEVTFTVQQIRRFFEQLEMAVYERQQYLQSEADTDSAYAVVMQRDYEPESKQIAGLALTERVAQAILAEALHDQDQYPRHEFWDGEIQAVPLYLDKPQDTERGVSKLGITDPHQEDQ